MRLPKVIVFSINKSVLHISKKNSINYIIHIINIFVAIISIPLLLTFIIKLNSRVNFSNINTSRNVINNKISVHNDLRF